MAPLGSAAEAAKLFGLGLSAFNLQRARGTYILHLEDGRIEPVGPRALTRAELSGLHLVAPSYGGEKRPGARWEYDLHAIRQGRLRHTP